MLPPQLKPSTNHSVGIKYQKVVSFVKDIPLKTTKQQEALNYIKEHDLLPIKDPRIENICMNILGNIFNFFIFSPIYILHFL